MKDSGISWLGEIPAKWSVQSLKHLASISTGNRDTIEKDPNGAFPFFVRSEKVERIASYSYDGEAVLIPGDGNVGSIFHHYIGKYDCHQRVYNITNFTNVSGCFIYYYMSACFKYEVDKGTAKSTVESLRLPMLMNFPVCLGSLEEQNRIVSILNNNCRVVDDIIRLQSQILDDLKDLKQSIISEVVTKGLDVSVSMKDSGIPWIGTIPSNWRTTRMKNVCSLKGRIGWQGLKSSEFTDEGPYVITGVDFKNGLIDWNSCNHFSESRFEEDPTIHVKEGDLLISKDGTIGKVAIAINTPEKVSLNSGVMLIRPFVDIDRNYLRYILLSNQFWDWYNSSQRGNSTIKHLYQEQFYDFRFTQPPVDIQKQISDYLDNICLYIDNQIQCRLDFITTLEEYRNSIIYEYVTGKRLICEEVS